MDSRTNQGGLARFRLANHVCPVSVQPISDCPDSAQPITVCVLPIPTLPGASRPVTAMGFAPLCSANHGTACIPSTNHEPGLSHLVQSWCDLCPLNQSHYLTRTLPTCCLHPACMRCLHPTPVAAAVLPAASLPRARTLPAPCLQRQPGVLPAAPPLTLHSLAGGHGPG